MNHSQSKNGIPKPDSPDCPGRRGAKRQTATFTAGLRLDGLTAPMLLDGAMNGVAFLAYVEQVLVPTLVQAIWSTWTTCPPKRSPVKQVNIRDSRYRVGSPARLGYDPFPCVSPAHVNRSEQRYHQTLALRKI